ncbi:hypothetical protein [Halorubrum pallidum]|uniref:N-acetyltransferase domain-containing protein n=1 Tax=Halorubrum pallidum TaxID=1526114 RepID=A0ABD5SZI2_9EURY
MRIRDALESDGDAIAAATDRPRSVVIDTIHERSVRVAVTDPMGEGHRVDSGTEQFERRSDEGDVIGFVAFDASGNTVHVSDFAGDEAAVRRLLDEPRRFATRESMSLEVVVPVDDDVRSVVSEMGFEAVGSGPRFAGRETARYRIEADDLTEEYEE